MKIKKINSSAHEDLDVLLKLYKESFPNEERRLVAGLKNLIDNEKDYIFLAIYIQNNLVGFMTYWNFKTFYFGEFFAIMPQFRNQNIGSRVLKKLKEMGICDFIFEVERPETQIAARRIKFYERAGYKIISKDYELPKKFRDITTIKMYLMGSEKHKAILDEIIDKIYSRVYVNYVNLEDN